MLECEVSSINKSINGHIFHGTEYNVEHKKQKSEGTLNNQVNFLTPDNHFLRQLGITPLHDLPLLERFLTPEMFVYFCQKSGLSPPETLRRIAEMLKFLILVRNFPGNIIFGKEIDEIWHLWVLQTREYEMLCAALPGGEIRHHCAREYPETPVALRTMMKELAEKHGWAMPDEMVVQGTSEQDDEAEQTRAARSRFEMNAQRILSFFASYFKNFGPMREENVPLWPPLQRMMERLEWNTETLNAFLAGQVAKAQAAQ